MKESDDFNLDGTNTAINKNRVWGKIDGHISLTNNKTENRSIWFDELNYDHNFLRERKSAKKEKRVK